jgi:hypothetical protein
MSSDEDNTPYSNADFYILQIKFKGLCIQFSLKQENSVDRMVLLPSRLATTLNTSKADFYLE